MAPLCRAVDIAPDDIATLPEWAARQRIDLAVIGPEAPLAAGMADRMRARGVPVFGPSAAAARIESSKAFAKELMAGAGVPTARYEVHDELGGARAFIEELGAPVVVKASGLAAGKGAIVCSSTEEAVNAARTLFAGALGEAGMQVVIEEFMEGEELSVFYLADGEACVPLLPAQDHKRIDEGDRGPNTGGMGAFAPVGLAGPELLGQVEREIVRPVLRALAERGSSFQGLLYAGLMITPTGPRVVEFNCRFGDPETQAILPLLSSSLLEAMVAVAEGSGPESAQPLFAPGAAVATVLAARGYPGSYRTGDAIRIPASAPDTFIFHAGTALSSAGELTTSGGRVLAVAAVGRDFAEAQTRSRAGAEAIQFNGKHFRRDIGWHEAERGRIVHPEPIGRSDP